MKKLKKKNMSKWEASARKKLERARILRNKRRTPYPFGFEYKRERRDG